MKKLFLLLVTVLTISLCASAQMQTVKGIVLDADNDEPLIGVSVMAGPGTGAATDADGRFSIQVPASAKTLKVSYVGYKTQEVKIGTGLITVRLHSDSELLDEVIAVAYGTATRASFTGSAAVVGSAEIENAQVSNPLNALKGKVAGVQMSNASGAPGQDSPSILIRGISSINAGTSPLIIVDGTPYSGSIQNLNTNDIESMTVLKDAASAALYGARGANGVILITTKRAKAGEATVTVDIRLGSNSKALPNYKYITDPAQYYETYFKALNNYALASGYNASGANAWANARLFDAATYGLGYNMYTLPNGQSLIGLNGKLNPNATLGRLATYKDQEFWLTPDSWEDAAYHNALRQQYNLSVAKGTDTSNFYLSAGYLDNKGITPQSGYERFTGRLAADTQAKPWLKVGGDMSYTYSYMDQYGSDEGSSGSTGNPFAYVSTLAPIYPLYVRDADGKIKVDDNGLTVYDYGAGNNAGLVRPALGGNANGIGAAMMDKAYQSTNAFSAAGNIEVKLPYGFRVTANQGIDVFESRSTSFTNPFYGQYATSNGMLYKTSESRVNYTFQQLVNWAQDYGMNHVSALIGHETYWMRYKYLSGSRKNMFDPENMELAGMIQVNDANSGSSAYNNEGWLFRGQYDYDNRYFGSVSFRRDASSRFHPKHRWGSFWSFGGAWIINKEDFMMDYTWIDMLKLKVSYGEQGNDNIGDFLYINTYDVVNSNDEVSIVPYRMGNENITWEKNGNLNAGIEFSFWNRLSGSVEYFYRKTSDMLFAFPLPPSMGWTSYYANVGDMTNNGVEIELNATILNTKDFTWDISANLTWYKNRISRLPEERRTSFLESTPGFSSGSYYYGEGLPMYTFRLQRYAGVDPENGASLWYKWKDDLELPEGKTADECYKFSPENVETTSDYAKASYFDCGTGLPKVYGGFSTSFQYKWFDLSVSFDYSLGGQVYDGTYASMMSSPTANGGRGFNIHADILNAWTPDNTTSNIPRFQYGDTYFASSSDRWLISSNYLNLQNISFGFTLPDKVAKKLFLKSCRVYATADNVWLWSKRQGLDPRQSVTGSNSGSYYSPIRTISGGINISF